MWFKRSKQVVLIKRLLELIQKKKCYYIKLCNNKRKRRNDSLKLKQKNNESNFETMKSKMKINANVKMISKKIQPKQKSSN